MPTSGNCRIERLVEWVDTDAAGISHNSAIMRWVEACEVQLLRELDLLSYFPGAPRVQQTINFTATLRFGQPVLVELMVERIGTSSLTFAFVVIGGAHEGGPAVRAAHGTVVVVHVPTDGTTSAPWPDDFRDRIAGRPWTSLDPQPDAA